MQHYPPSKKKLKQKQKNLEPKLPVAITKKQLMVFNIESPVESKDKKKQV